MKVMKGNIFRRLSILFVVMFVAVCRTASAQTYSGYLKLDDVSIKAPDSLLVTITVPENAYIRDTVILSRREYKAMRKSGEYSSKPYYATPWMLGFKTNLLSDAIVIPYGGLEIQLARNLSLDLNGWYSRWNVFYPNKQTNIYGLAPELRWWFGGRAMTKGYFVGLHANAAWYTIEWRDKDGATIIYQNGIDDRYDSGTKYPALSFGLTYGYSHPLDRKGHWNLEYYVGLGYSSYQQKRIYPAEDGKTYFKHEVNTDIGITKVGINLSYRFSLRRYRTTAPIR